MRSLFVVALVVVALVASGASAVNLDLEDCDILIGQSQRQEFDAYMASQRVKAGKGNLFARKVLAAIANNRFACYLNDLDEGAGWSVMSIPDKNAAAGGASVMSTRVVDAAAIMKSRDAHESLRKAFEAAQALADEDIAYRNMASVYVADYAEAFPEKYAAAYRDALGVRDVACRYPEKAPGESGKSLCLSAKSAIASLYLKLPESERASLEKDGMAWAVQYLKRNGRREK